MSMLPIALPLCRRAAFPPYRWNLARTLRPVQCSVRLFIRAPVDLWKSIFRLIYSMSVLGPIVNLSQARRPSTPQCSDTYHPDEV